ncbi:MAG: aminoacyl-tRNA hydrolase [Candidatus Syntrophonatronum acetioxidans]|uniref:Peptidyl-tRNA hydrolase n=1 Tax=Candidatus Syntrophonatronum acetioxidans TaxID=1795816 RepID=A0A424YC18_9FIRM|nr:MAG: aminoacyl-tRNA hydrolase [Candidatus Syntrophonatronum acetioxidans]
MKLIVGLGNPGKEYLSTRHNIGFMVVDSLAKKHNINLNRLRGSSAAGKGVIRGEEILLAKPLTYMNLSGRAVKALVAELKASPSDIIVIHDDLDLDLGRLRLRGEGGTGGHRGIASIIEKLGTESFNRLRIGIGRPRENQEARDYVLEEFSREEEVEVEEVISRAVKALETFMVEGIQSAMNKHNC